MSLRTYIQDHPTPLVWSWEATAWVLRRIKPLFAKMGMETSSKIVKVPEEIVKGLLFNCQDCAQCMLHYNGMTCPMNCPKNLRNGPCGGVRLNGHCEVKPEMDCVWVKGLERAPKTPYGHEILRLNPPVDWRLKGQASWVTYSLGRDQIPTGTDVTIRYADEALPKESVGMNAPTPPVAPAAPIQTGLTGASSNLAKVIAAGHFPVCVEISPPVGPNVEAIQREIKTLKGYGDAYNVTDNQSAMVHVSSLAVSIMLKQAGMEPVIQFTCRDRNRLGIQGDMLGGSVFGINTILCLSGDHPIWGDHPQCKPVYDMDSLNVIRMARMMRNNQVFENGKQIPKIAPDFFIGAVENPFAPPYDYRPLRLAKKIVAGAQFIQTQLIFNVDRFREFMKRVVDLGLHEKIAILAGVGPIRSIKAAEYMKNEVAGMDVPDWVLKRLEGLSKEDQQKAGLDICCEVANQVREIEGVKGLHIMAVSWPAAVPEVCKMLGLYPRPTL